MGCQTARSVRQSYVGSNFEVRVQVDANDKAKATFVRGGMYCLRA